MALSIFSYVYSPSVYPLYRNVHSVPLVVFFNSYLLSFYLYFIDYVITVVSIFPPLLLHPAPITPSGNPYTIVHVHRSCIGAFATSFAMLYFTSPWLICNCLSVLLNPLTFSPIPHHHPPIWQPSNALHIHDSLSVLVCLVCFSDSIVDRFVFFCNFIAFYWS